MSQTDLDSEDMAILKEVASIGMGNASRALEQLLCTKIDISLPEVELIELKDIGKHFTSEEILLGVVLKVVGDIKGKMLYLFKMDDATAIIQLINKNNSGNISLAEDMKVSTIKEMANILSGSYLNSLSKFISMNLLPALPHLAMDNAASIFGLASLSDEEEVHIILVKSKLSILGGEFEAVGSLVLELNKEELIKLIYSIKKKYNAVG